MKRLDERFDDFCNALDRLKEAMKIEDASEVEIDGALKRYEFTFELSWKTIKDYLEYNGITENIASPRTIITQAFQSGVIKDGEIWINMMLDRNSLSHLYDEEKSRQIYQNIKEKYIEEFEELKEFLSDKI